MANDIRVCDKCKHVKLKTMVQKLQNMAPDAEIKIGCKSYCGPCGKRAFVFVNGRYVSAPTEEEVLAKAAPFIKN
ncbi:YuzB family protein [Neobacillus mesonae]|nr:YuzB family protein [Neobacillus mesonae]